MVEDLTPKIVPPHVPLSVAFGGLQQHAAGVQGAAGDPQFAGADAAACVAFAGAPPVGTGGVGLDSFT